MYVGAAAIEGCKAELNDGTIEHFISKILKMLALEDFLIKGLI
tara:strand:+ start:118 stop:246 length:129 start_codon:yes stop_codon:yes gene_type:complete